MELYHLLKDNVYTETWKRVPLKGWGGGGYSPAASTLCMAHSISSTHQPRQGASRHVLMEKFTQYE